MLKKIQQFLPRLQKLFKTDVRYILRGGFWLMVSRLVAILTSLVAMTALANLLPQETFGAYSYVLAVVTIVGITTLPGMAEALARAVSRGHDGAFDQTTRARIRFGFIGSVILVGFALFYAFEHNTQLATAFFLFALLVPFVDSVKGQVFYFFVGKEQFKTLATYKTLFNVGMTIALVVALIFSNNLGVIIATYFGSHALFALLLIRIVRRHQSNQRTDNATIPFGRHLTALKVISIVANNIDSVILWHFLGPAPVALYQLIKIPAEKVKIALPILELALPRLSKKQLDARTKASIMRKFIQLTVLFIPLFGLLALLAPVVYRVLFPSYIAAVPYFQVLSVTVIFLPSMLLTTSFTAALKKRELYLTQVITPIVQIVLFMALIPVFELWGVVMALIASQLFNAGFSVFLFLRLPDAGTPSYPAHPSAP